MSALVAALDTHTPTQVGNNGHLQYGWSNDIKEKILQFSFQLTRCDKSIVRTALASKFREIMAQVPVSAKIDDNNLLTLIMQMILHTRDIVNGKGEYELAYMMIYELYGFYPELSEYALRSLVRIEESPESHPYGSWKDIKYFCNYVREQRNDEHPLIKIAHGLMIDQLRRDEKIDSRNNASLSLAGRWAPREGSKKFGWQFNIMAKMFFPLWVTGVGKWTPQEAAAVRKCCTHYRHLLSDLNRRLDTVQIKQTANTWAEIKYENVTSITMRKQNKAFRNVKPNKGEERVDSNDRRAAAENFDVFLSKAKKGEAVVKGKRVSLIDFARDALRSNDSGDKQVLNMQWRDNSSQTGALPNMIPMIDTSGSMTADDSVPLYSAIGLGIRIAEKSKLKNRAMTFSAAPAWINYDNCKEFTDKVNVTQQANWGFNTNFTAALKLILSAIEEARLAPREVSDMVLVILSDMQIDANGNERMDSSMLAHIDRLYHETGIRVHGEPYKRPTILFWNLSKTNGFPSLSTAKGAMMMSGASPALLNMFCEKGIDALSDYTPWRMFVETMNHTRYSCVKDYTDLFIAEAEC
ncbi:MAG: DUF2828 family protein [Candidatus Thorarchaeota archaeon]|jgi:hypothetical protein